MMCLAIDYDLHKGLLEFGPSPFHEVVGVVKKMNKQAGGFTNSKKNRKDSDDEGDQSVHMMENTNEDLF